MGATIRMGGAVEDTTTLDAPTLEHPTAEIVDEAPTLEHETRPDLPNIRARRCPECRTVFSGDARFCPFDGDPLVDAPDYSPGADPLIGQTIEGRYRVGHVLGEGGMGTIYEVTHTTLGRKFALKVLRRDLADDELTARFIQEAKAAASIGHPNIVAVNDFGTLQIGRTSAPYFVMERLEGETLAEILRREISITPRRAAGIVAQCVSGLAAAHAAGVIHRDLKPDNIFLTRVADREFVKLLDFGVAKIVGAGRLTVAGTVFGTPHYMSPEQAGGHEIDHRADIYAVGVILYECLSSRVPFEADTYMGVLTKHMFAAPEPIEQAVGDGRRLGGLGPIVMRCLAKTPGERFATMEEVGAALELFLHDPPSSAAAGLDRVDRGVRTPATFRLRDAGSVEGRLSLPQPPVTRIWPKLLAIGLGLTALVAVLRFAGSSSARTPAPSASAASVPASVAPPPPIPVAAPAAPTTAAAAPIPSAPAEPSSTGAHRGGHRAPPHAPPTAPAGQRTPHDVVDPWAK